MASVIKRGTRDRPKWYWKLKIDGVWKMLPTHKPTKSEARSWAEENEGHRARGLPFEDPEPEAEKTFGEALDYSLKTHSAVALVSHHDNELRAKVLREAFGDLRISKVTAVRVAEFNGGEALGEGEGRGGQGVAGALGGHREPDLGLLRKVMNDSARWASCRPSTRT